MRVSGRLPAPETRFGELLSLAIPSLRHQHGGCQTQGKGGVADGIAELTATDARTGAKRDCRWL